jgi:ferric-dicitrate binding protein FerR (iron transport regulator)
MQMETCRWCGTVIINDYNFDYCSRKCFNEYESDKAEKDRAWKAAWDALTPEQKKEYEEHRRLKEEQRSLELRQWAAEYDARQAEKKREWFWIILIWLTGLAIWIGIRKYLGYW